MPHPVVHFEIPVDDAERARRFYSELFGWTMQSFEGQPDYTIVDTGMGERAVNGGMTKRQSPQHQPTNYVAVESVDEYSEKVKQLGGQVIIPRTAIPKMGYFAVCLDTEGNPIGLFEMDESAAM